MSIIIDLPAIEETTDWLMRRIADDYDNALHYGVFVSSDCASCRGRGRIIEIDGEYVCECVRESAWETVTRNAISGEWVIVEGVYQPV